MDRIERAVTVPDTLAGRRFDQIAAELLTEFSRSRLKRWIEGGCLTVDGRPAEPKAKLKGGETLALSAEPEIAVPVAPEPIALDIVYEDAAVLVIDKPAGLVVHPGAGNAAGTLQNALLHYDPRLATVPRAGLVHRLDKDTSGLLVVARHLTAQQALAAEIERHRVARIYAAICHGVLTGGGTVDAPLGRHAQDRTKMAVRDDVRDARTHYRVRRRFRAQTYIEVELETGRTHQIRVHMAHARHPLVGDRVYGGRPRLPKQPSEQVTTALQRFPRQALHAERLAFTHPESGQTLCFESPLPEDFEALLAALDRDARAVER